MNDAVESPRTIPRRSRWWLWATLGAFVLLAIAAVPAWRYYWHTEYKRHLHTISRNPRDSYHEPPRWSVLASVPSALQPIACRLRTVDLTSSDSRPITAEDIRTLNQIVRRRQFGLGVERLCLTNASLEVWDGLDGCQDLLYLQFRKSLLPPDAGRRLTRLRALNVLAVVGEPETAPPELRSVQLPASSSTRQPSTGRSPTRSLDELLFLQQQMSEAEDRYAIALNSLWEIPQLEELRLYGYGNLILSGRDYRHLRELNRVSLEGYVPRDELLGLAELPALRTLDLSGIRLNWMQASSEELAKWNATIAEIRKRRTGIDIIPPTLPTERELRKWKWKPPRRRSPRPKSGIVEEPSPSPTGPR